MMEEFFASVLPPEGPYVLAFKVKGSEGMTHKAYASFALMEKAGNRFAELGADTYLCIGSIKDREYRTAEGKVSLRNQNNIEELKSLILDLDVKYGSDKHFQTKEEALMGLFAFQKALVLPEPTVVDSGYGFHVWWPFEEAVDSEAWKRAATLLKLACRSFNPKLIADPTRVCDSSSLLRLPETWNYKQDERVATRVMGLASEVTPYGLYFEKLKGYLDAKGIKAKDEVLGKKALAKNSLSLFIDEPHSFTAMVRKCKWSSEYIKNQAKATEPEWYAFMGMLPFVSAPGKSTLDLAVMTSNKYKGYTLEATEKKLKQVTKAQQGPTLCERFQALNPTRCEGCAFREMVNTPVRLDMVDLPAAAPIIEQEVIKENGEIVIQSVQLLAPPKPYFRGSEGKGIYVMVGEGDEAVVKRIYEYDIYPIRRLKDEETDNEMLEISLTLPMDGHRLIKISNGLLTDPKRFTAELANKGVLVQTKEAASLTSYIIEYARKIQREEKAQEEFARFGWRDIDGDNPRFVLGELVVDTKGELRRATPAPYLKQVRDVISTKGTLEEWAKGFSVYKDIPDTEPLQFALMMAFAAPLLAMTPFHGLMYNMLGDSGSGKSTALKLMTSVWGKPNEHHIQVHDNRIPMFNTIGYLQSIPISFDELTTIASDTLADIVYAISEGRGKNRADRSGNTRENTVHWKTIVCGTSNSSLYEKLGMSRSGNNAHAYRIFEVNVLPANTRNRPAIEEALTRVEADYGMAGRLFILYVIRHLPEIRKQIAEAAIEFAKQFNMPTAERFWFNLFATMAVGGKIAYDLGLHQYDVNKIIAWCATQLVVARDTVSTVEGDAMSTFAHFMQTNLASTLIVRDGTANPLNLGSAVQKLLIRLEYADNHPTFGYVSVPALKEHCRLLQVEYGWMLKKLEEVKIVLDVEHKKLGEGTTMLTGQTRCWKIDLQHPIMQGTL